MMVCDDAQDSRSRDEDRGNEQSGWQRSSIGMLRRANDVLRRAFPGSDLSMGSVQALLLIAETPAQPISAIAEQMQMSFSGAQRILLGLSGRDSDGRQGPALIEQIVDPNKPSRKIFFLSDEGSSLINEVLNITLGGANRTKYAGTAREFLAEHDKSHTKRKGVQINLYTPQQIATAKRSLRRKGVEVGRYVIAFPLRPAEPMIAEIKTWLDERGGTLRELENVGKPDGMALAELPTPEEQVAFVLTFRSPR